MRKVALATLCLLISSGCAKKYCEKDQDYAQAREYPPLSAPSGLEVPAQDPNLKIPKARGDAQTALSDDRRCLEMPPRMRSEGQPAS